MENILAVVGDDRMYKKSHLFAVALDESFYRAVICTFYIRREKASGQFTHLPVVSNALAALALSRTRFICAGAFLHICFDVAFHFESPSL
jgi:hypothetical protein